MTLEIQLDRSLTRLNTLGLNTRAERFVHVCTESDLREALALAREKSWPVTLLGGGSNLVFRGNVVGLVIHVGVSGIRFDGTFVEAGAGESWHQVVLSSLEQGLSGIENLSLIPGSAGAAPIQNIGAYGVELADTFETLVAIDRESLETVTLTRSDCRFGYRDSIFKQALRDRLVVTRIRLRLSNVFVPNLEYAGLQQEMESASTRLSPLAVSQAVCAIRRRKLPDPDLIGNVGSFFKNPIIEPSMLEVLKRDHAGIASWQTESGIKISAGWLIEQCGLSGASVGGAMVSPKHALVLINAGKAAGEDILALASLIQSRILTRFGIRLDIEPVIY